MENGGGGELTAVHLRGCHAHEVKVGAGQRVPMGPPMIAKRHWTVRVKGAEVSSGLPHKGGLATNKRSIG